MGVVVDVKVSFDSRPRFFFSAHCGDLFFYDRYMAMLGHNSATHKVTNGH